MVLEYVSSQRFILTSEQSLSETVPALSSPADPTTAPRQSFGSLQPASLKVGRCVPKPVRPPSIMAEILKLVDPYS